MAGKWYNYWANLGQSIQNELAQWKQSGQAIVQLPGLTKVSKRADLYSCVTITIHGPSANVGGKQHMLDLARTIAPMLNSGEIVRVCIVNKNNQDYLEFS